MHLSVFFPHHPALSSSISVSGRRRPGSPVVPRVVFKDGACVSWIPFEGLFWEAASYFCVSHDHGAEELL